MRGLTPLIIATHRGNIEIVKLLLEAGAVVDLPTELGQTALITAILGNRLDMVDILMDAGAVVDHIREKGFTPLMMASKKGRIEIVKLLLEAGADPNIQRFISGWTALMFASDKGDIIVEELLAAGADLDTQENDGNTALLIALKKYKLGKDNLPTIFEIIKYKPDPDIRNNNGETAIELAEELGLDSVVDALMHLNNEKMGL